MMQWRLSSTKTLYLLAFLGIVSSVPRLFQQGGEEKEESPFLAVVQSNAFENMVLITLALAFPAVLDVFADLISKKDIMICDDEQVCRVFLSSSLTCQPLLLYYFGVMNSCLVCTNAILHIQAISTASIVIEQLHSRCACIFNLASSFLILLLWIVGHLIEVYLENTDPRHNLLFLVGLLFEWLSGLLFILLMGWVFVDVAYKRNLLELNEKNFVVPFGSLILVGLVAKFVVDITMSFNNIYEFKSVYILGSSYVTSIFQFLYSIYLTQQFRFELAVEKEKLSVNRQFVRYVNHEVRTPLNSCLLGLSYLRNICAEPTSEDSLISIIDEISGSCRVAIDFMNNMLISDKMESLHSSLDVKDVNLRDLCLKSYEEFVLISRHMKIPLSLDIHDTINVNGQINPFIQADPSQLLVVFRNLLSNAFKYTSTKGSVRFKLVPIHLPCAKNVPLHAVDKSPSDQESTTHYRIIVEDDGVGLSFVSQKHLFGDKLHFNPNGSQIGGGSGMGIYLARKIVAAHSANIFVHSEGKHGKGSKFWIDFPKSTSISNLDLESNLRNQSCGEEEENGDYFDNLSVETLPRNYEADVSSTGRSFLKSRSTMSSRSASAVHDKIIGKPIADLSIVIVDDSPMTRKMVRRVLLQNKIGASFTEAADGVELLNIMCPTGQKKNASSTKVYPLEVSCKYDVLIVDRTMPLLNGDIATAKLRELGYNGIIFGLTGNALEDDIQSFNEMGADYTFTKPLDIEKFRDVLSGYTV